MKTAILVGAVVLVAVGVAWSPTLPRSGISERVFLPLGHVRGLVQAGNYQQAMKELDDLRALPNKTADETTVVRQMRDYLLAKLYLPADAQPR